MLANYGFEDGTGTYIITINTDLCAECEDADCMGSCPEDVYAIEEDDYGDDVLIVRPDKAHKLRECCVTCKAHKTADEVPCISSCKYQAITHSW